MEFMLLFLLPTGTPDPEPAGMAEMTRFVEGLARAGKLRRGAPLGSKRTRVRKGQGKTLVTDGPFAETKEMIGGFWIVEVADRAEAIDIAGRTPHARDGIVEVHPIEIRRVHADSGRHTPFLLTFHMTPDLSDPDGAKRSAMRAFGEELARAGILIESAKLAGDPPAARITAQRGKPLIVDGPFAESKEVVGGYGVVRLTDRDAAIALAERYPHAMWGAVEIGEILFFDRT